MSEGNKQTLRVLSVSVSLAILALPFAQRLFQKLLLAFAACWQGWLNYSLSCCIALCVHAAVLSSLLHHLRSQRERSFSINYIQNNRQTHQIKIHSIVLRLAESQ